MGKTEQTKKKERKKEKGPNNQKREVKKLQAVLV